MALTTGSRLGHYEILGPIGAGGMGEVYRARHRKLARDVAIKVLPADIAGDRARLARFEREARTASALNHPNIVTIYDIDVHEETTFIAMELVDGQTIEELTADANDPLPVGRVLRIVAQIASALAAAHARGIIHRDIKPANVMVTEDGLVKILDFGLAKPLEGMDAAGRTQSLTGDTRDGMIVGTPRYMSPEQLSGDAVDHRSDQFALGVLLYEMLIGKPPFDGPSLRAIIGAIIAAPTPPLRHARSDVPVALEQVVRRTLEKDPDERFASMNDVAAELRRVEARYARGQSALRLLRNPAVATPLAVVALAVGAAGWVWVRGADRRWAEREAAIEITRLSDEGAIFEAYRTALRAQRYAPGNATLTRLLDRISLPLRVTSHPEGAEVWVSEYATPHAEWTRVGTTPLSVRVPYALMRWRMEKAGYEPFEGAPFSGGAIAALVQGMPLDSAGARPPGSVRIPAIALEALPRVFLARDGPPVELESFFIDRYEVTNRQYREFVEAGGYADRRWWPERIVREGRPIPWPEAMTLLVDATGRAGPATWEVGSYPTGRDEHPVGGISWYEAAAYCAWAGKSLPTIYHWYGAVGQEQLSDILVHSNIDRDAPAPVGEYQGLGAFGTYDMAGNVREWAWNAAGEKRYLLGGASNEPAYLFTFPFAQDPMTREPSNGVRCATYPTAPRADLMTPVMPRTGYERAPPLGDEAFAVLRAIYTYDRTPLDARIERVNDSMPAYRRETVSFRTAYGEERMEVHLLIPRDVPPPYQSVVWFPGGDVFLLASSDRFSSEYMLDFIPASGRVLVHPVFKGMYERFEPPAESPSALRDVMIRWSQDLGRTIDYLETRPEFDVSRIAYYGFSWGATIGPVLNANETRLAASILLAGGLVPRSFRPEANPATFAPHSRVPTLMINGRDDFMMPYELSQRPLYDMLGAPEHRKRHALLAGGHIPSSRSEIIREVLDWLDQYLGPVNRGN